MHHKLMSAMARREDRNTLLGATQMDDAYPGGNRNGGKGVGRGSEIKASFVPAVSLTPAGHPHRKNLTPVAGFACAVQKAGAQTHLGVGEHGALRRPGLLDCHNHCRMSASGHGRRRPQLEGAGATRFQWTNTVLGHLNISLSGAYPVFRFKK